MITFLWPTVDLYFFKCLGNCGSLCILLLAHSFRFWKSWFYIFISPSFLFNIQGKVIVSNQKKNRTRCELDLIKYLAIARVFLNTEFCLFLKLEFNTTFIESVTARLVQVEYQLSETQLFSVMQLTTKIKITLKFIWIFKTYWFLL